MAKKRSLYLNEDWDITLSNSGDVATTKGLYCDAQNVANIIRLFTKDAYLAQNRGVPHFDLDLGKKPALSQVRAVYRKTAKQVENIADARVEITGVDSDTRTLRGVIFVQTISGENVSVEI
jgi:hypothetical protein